MYDLKGIKSVVKVRLLDALLLLTASHIDVHVFKISQIALTSSVNTTAEGIFTSIIH